MGRGQSKGCCRGSTPNARYGRYARRYGDREEKYKRRAPTDWFLRWWKTMMKPAAQRRRGALGWVVVLLLAALALFTLVALFSYLARGGSDDPLLDPMNNPNIRVNGIV